MIIYLFSMQLKGFEIEVVKHLITYGESQGSGQYYSQVFDMKSSRGKHGVKLYHHLNHCCLKSRCDRDSDWLVLKMQYFSYETGLLSVVYAGFFQGGGGAGALTCIGGTGTCRFDDPPFSDPRYEASPFPCLSKESSDRARLLTRPARRA